MSRSERPASLRFSFSTAEEAFRVLGPADTNLRTLERLMPGLHLRALAQDLYLDGEQDVRDRAFRVIEELALVASRGTVITEHVLDQVLSMLEQQQNFEDQPDQPVPSPSKILTENILSSRGRNIRPKTLNQQRYVESIDDHTVVFGLGPAGTGKTYLAMAKAVQALQRKEVTRIILTRPAVEAGERLGYLPGTLNEKIDPYLRPLYDALHDMIDPESIPRLMEAGTIEVAPLAFMRGRTLNDAFIILDEAQNTTADQMKMFLTRLGFGSKMVVTGDASQVDLPGGTRSGLGVVEGILDGVEDIDFVHLSSSDVVRHRLVSDIVNAYGVWENS